MKASTWPKAGSFPKPTVTQSFSAAFSTVVKMIGKSGLWRIMRVFAFEDPARTDAASLVDTMGSNL